MYITMLRAQIADLITKRDAALAELDTIAQTLTDEKRSANETEEPRIVELRGEATKAHDKIADRLFEQKRVAETKKYLAKLRSQAIIEWKNEELRKAYDTIPKDEPPAPPPTEAKPDATAAKPPETS